VPDDSGKPNRKRPERADALRVDLPFEEAVRAALDTKPPTIPKKQTKRRPNQSASG